MHHFCALHYTREHPFIKVTPSAIPWPPHVQRDKLVLKHLTSEWERIGARADGALLTVDQADQLKEDLQWSSLVAKACHESGLEQVLTNCAVALDRLVHYIRAHEGTEPGRVEAREGGPNVCGEYPAVKC